LTDCLTLGPRTSCERASHNDTTTHTTNTTQHQIQTVFIQNQTKLNLDFVGSAAHVRGRLMFSASVSVSRLKLREATVHTVWKP
jgi:DNA-binding transcriptional regulator/RsmH inhibitor MraZ